MRGSFSSGWTCLLGAGALAVALAPLALAPQASGQCSLHNGNLPGPPATQLTQCCRQVGPDVIVGAILNLPFNTSVETVGAVAYDAFSFGTTSCNIGNRNLHWDAFPSVTHPAIQQGLFKYKNGRLEQIGISWLKHGFTALTENECGCGCNGTGGQLLGIGCADPYTASRNASQGSLKPRWYVNAHTGVYPSSQPVASGSGTTYRRLRVKTSDLEPSNGSTVRYFAECQYITQDDAYWDNNDNNASYREIQMSGSGDYTATPIGVTQREQPGIRAWKDIDNNVIETDVQVAEPAPTSQGGGCTPAPCTTPSTSSNTSSLVIVAARATYLSGTQWQYDYAVQNVNADTSIGSFTVPLPDGVTLTNIGFHDVDYHSGDGTGNVNYSGADWVVAQTANSIKWTCAEPWNVGNDLGNAIRWGTMYNFRFTANRPPSRTAFAGGQTNVTLGTYKTAGNYNALTAVPDNDCNNNNVGDSIDLLTGVLHDVNTNGIPDECEQPQTCSGDVAQPANGIVNVDDLLVVINSWGPCPGCPADINNNGVVNVDDLLAVINAWGPCP